MARTTWLVGWWVLWTAGACASVGSDDTPSSGDNVESPTDDAGAGSDAGMPKDDRVEPVFSEGDGATREGSVVACGSENLAPQPILSNLVLVLDRSCSMNVDAGADTKWGMAVAAIERMTATFAGKILFGMT